MSSRPTNRDRCATGCAGLVTLTEGAAQLASGQLGLENQYPLKLAAAAIMAVPVAVLFFVFLGRIMSTSAGAEKG